jgi:hypothetical protein
MPAAEMLGVAPEESSVSCPGANGNICKLIDLLIYDPETSLGALLAEPKTTGSEA